MTDYSALGALTGPAETNVDAAVNLGHEFYVTSQAWLKAFRFWRADTNTSGLIRSQLYEVVNATTGNLIVGVTGTYILNGTGWQEVLIEPYELTPNQRYKVVTHYPQNYAASGDFWTADRVSGPLVMVSRDNSQGGTHQGSFDYGAAFNYCANGSGNAGCYWTDVLVTDSLDENSSIKGSFFML